MRLFPMFCLFGFIYVLWFLCYCLCTSHSSSLHIGISWIRAASYGVSHLATPLPWSACLLGFCAACSRSGRVRGSSVPSPGPPEPLPYSVFVPPWTMVVEPDGRLLQVHLVLFSPSLEAHLKLVPLTANPKECLCEWVWYVLCDMMRMTRRWHQILTLCCVFLVQVSLDQSCLVYPHFHVQEWDWSCLLVLSSSELNQSVSWVQVI